MQALYLEIKNLIINTLNLDELTAEDINTDAALFGDGLGLDSIDALEQQKVKKCDSIFIPWQHWPLLFIHNAPENEPFMTEQRAIYQEVSALLTKLFEIDPDDIKPQARLYEDLELDSIDAVDMIVQLQKKTGKKIKPEEFKAVRTVQDVVEAVERLLKEA